MSRNVRFLREAERIFGVNDSEKERRRHWKERDRATAALVKTPRDPRFELGVWLYGDRRYRVAEDGSFRREK